MRLKSSIWVAAYVRRCNGEGAFAAVRRRGAEEAGAIFVVVSRPQRTATLYAPAPQSALDDGQVRDRMFIASLGAPDPVAENAIDTALAREIRFDPDLWIVEVEDRDGRHFLDLAKA